MKILTFIVLSYWGVLCAFTQNTEQQDSQTEKLYGKWRHVKSGYKSPGSGWSEVSEDTTKYVEFFKDGKIGGNYFDGSRYRIKHSLPNIISSSEITVLEVDANDKIVGEYYLEFDDKKLILRGPYCDEGCYESFVRAK